MENILIWGAGATYKCYLPWFQMLEEEKEIKILALVDRMRAAEDRDGYKVIVKEEIKEFAYDRIVITAIGMMLESIIEDAKGLLDNSVNTKITTVTDYETEYARKNNAYYDAIVDTQLKVLQEILSASDEEIADYNWMYSRICRYGLYPFKTDMERDQPLMLTAFGVMQVVDEFTRYCNFVGSLTVETAIELGVYRGRSSYLICALLARKNPALTYILADIQDRLDSFERYREVLPMLDKRIPSTSADYQGTAYDFVFIDADHSYDGSIEDYFNVGQYAKKIVCFHDIYGHEYDRLNGGTVRTWQEVQQITEDKGHKVFSKYPEQWMGIGCVII